MSYTVDIVDIARPGGNNAIYLLQCVLYMVPCPGLEWAQTGQRIYIGNTQSSNHTPNYVISLVNHCVVNQFISLPLFLEALENPLWCTDLATVESDPYQRLEGIRGSTCVKWILLRTSALETLPLAKTNNNMDADGMGGTSDCVILELLHRL